MVYIGDYTTVKRKCKQKIEDLTKELETALEAMGYNKTYSTQASLLFEEEIEDLIEGIIDQIEAHIIGEVQTTFNNPSGFNVSGASLGSRGVYYSNVGSTQQRVIGEEKKIVLGKEEEPSEEPK